MKYEYEDLHSADVTAVLQRRARDGWTLDSFENRGSKTRYYFSRSVGK